MLIYRTAKRATCRWEGKVLLYKKKKKKKVEERAPDLEPTAFCPEAVDSFDPRCVVTSLHRLSLNFHDDTTQKKEDSLSPSLGQPIYTVFVFFESL